MHVKVLIITDGIMPSVREMEQASVVLRIVGMKDTQRTCEIEKHPRMKKGDRVQISDLVL